MKKETLFKVIIFSFIAVSCRQNDGYLYHVTPKPVESQQFEFKIKEMVGRDEVDILWVVDNSGSMEPFQTALFDNTDIFLQEFLQKGDVKWRMGLISTDRSDSPYVGFDPLNRLEDTSIDAADRFRRAIRRLGTDGDYVERTITPVMNHLDQNPDFVRNQAYFILIMLTDEEEQSSSSARDFIRYVEQMKGDLKWATAYGIFEAEGLNCDRTEWRYAGSRYERIVNGIGGKTYSLCTGDFGEHLANLAQDIVKKIKSKRILLKIRPLPRSIQIYFRGAILPGGSKSEGGFWTYDYNTNEIVFHDLSFAAGDNESVEVRFIPDDGQPLFE